MLTVLQKLWTTLRVGLQSRGLRIAELVREGVDSEARLQGLAQWMGQTRVILWSGAAQHLSVFPGTTYLT